MRGSFVLAERFLVFKVLATYSTLDLLLDATVERENVSLGLVSQGKVFTTDRAPVPATLLYKLNVLLSHKPTWRIEQL